MIKGGGAQAASDKVIQHNGKGQVTIDGFSKYLCSVLAFKHHKYTNDS
jgi:ribose 5-phosphate isomerase